MNRPPRKQRGLLIAAIALLSATWLPACISAPRVELQLERIRIVARDPDMATRVAADAERFEAELIQALDELRAVPIEVRVPLQSPSGVGVNWPPADPPRPAWERSRPARVVIRLSTVYRPAYLAQELIRARLGEVWDPLPPFLVQGLAEVLADRWTPGTGDELRYTLLANPERSTSVEVAWRLETGAPEPIRGELSWMEYVLSERPLEDDLEQLLELPSFYSFRSYDPEQRWQLFGRAYVFAKHVWDELGADGLRQLCDTARAEGRVRIDAASLLEAAGLDNPQRRERLGSASLLFPTYEALLDGTPLVRAIDDLWNANGGRYANRGRFLDNLEVVISIGSGPYFDSRELPAYEAWSERWTNNRP